MGCDVKKIDLNQKLRIASVANMKIDGFSDKEAVAAIGKARKILKIKDEIESIERAIKSVPVPNADRFMQSYKNRGVSVATSGAARGADSYWNRAMAILGLNVQNFIVPGSSNAFVKEVKSVKSSLNVTEVTEDDLKLGGIALRKAGVGITNDMNKRKYMQIANSDAVFAVVNKFASDADNTNYKYITGDTDSAVAMAIEKGIPVNVMIPNGDGVQWYSYDYNKLKFVKLDSRPKLTDYPALIGTRDLELYNTKKGKEFVPRKEYVGENAENAVVEEMIRMAAEKVGNIKYGNKDILQLSNIVKFGPNNTERKKKNREKDLAKHKKLYGEVVVNKSAHDVVLGSDESTPSGSNTNRGSNSGTVKINPVNDNDLSLGSAMVNMFTNAFGENFGENFSDEYANHVNYVHDKFIESLNNLDIEKIDFVEVFDNKDIKHVSGSANVSRNSITMYTTNNSRISNEGEIFIHEISHIASHEAFSKDIKLRDTVRALRDELVKSGIDYTMFLEGIPDPTEHEIAMAKQKYLRTMAKSADPEEFYAYAISNQRVYAKLYNLDVSTKLMGYLNIEGNGTKAKFYKMLNKIIYLVNKTYATSFEKDSQGKGNVVLKNIIDRVATVTAEQQIKKKEIEERKKLAIELSKSGESIEQNINNAGEKYIFENLDKLQDVLKKGMKAGKIGKTLNKVANKMPVVNSVLASGLFQSIFTQIFEDMSSEQNRDLFMSIMKSREKSNKEVGRLSEELERSIKQMIYNITDGKENKRLVDTIKTSMFNVDLSSIATTQDEINRVLDDLDGEYNRLRRQIANEVFKRDGNSKMFRPILAQAEGLAELMFSQNTNTVNNQQINANNIAKLIWDEENMPGGMLGVKINEFDKKSEKLAVAIDKFTTVIALKKLNEQQVKELRELSSKEDFLDMLTMYKTYIESSKRSSKGRTDTFRKGYNQSQSGLYGYKIVPKEEVPQMMVANYKLADEIGDESFFSRISSKKRDERIGASKPYMVIDGKEYYMMVGRSREAGFQEGAIGMISNTQEGTSLKDILKRDRIIEGDTDNEAEEFAKQYIENTHFEKTSSKLLDQPGSLVAIYNPAGDIIDYRIQMTYKDKLNLLDEYNEIEQTIAYTFSRTAKMDITERENEKVIDEILQHNYENLSSGDYEKDDLVLVKEAGKGARNKANERWDRMPSSTKEYIRMRTGSNSIMMPRKFVEMLTGEKDKTIANLNVFGKKLKDRNVVLNGALTAIESYAQELIAAVKKHDVMLNTNFIIPNIMSNWLRAVEHGVGPLEYIGLAREKSALLDEYTEMEAIKYRLQIEEAKGKDVTTELSNIIKRLESHEVHTFVEGGQFGFISEDIDLDDRKTGQLQLMMKNGVKNLKFGDKLQTAIDVMYVKDDGWLMNVARRNLAKQDAITRLVIRDKMIENMAVKNHNGDESKLSTSEMKYIDSYIGQLLVFYGGVVNSNQNYIDKTLGFPYLRYFFGNFKTLTLSARKNFARVTGLGAVQSTGIDVYDPYETYTGTKAINFLENRFLLPDLAGNIIHPNRLLPLEYMIN